MEAFVWTTVYQGQPWPLFSNFNFDCNILTIIWYASTNGTFSTDNDTSRPVTLWPLSRSFIKANDLMTFIWIFIFEP